MDSSRADDRLDTETLDLAVSIVCKEMRWEGHDELPGCFSTGFGDFDPLL